MTAISQIFNGTVQTILNGAGCLFLFLVICYWVKYRNGIK